MAHLRPEDVINYLEKKATYYDKFENGESIVEAINKMIKEIKENYGIQK